MSDTHSSTEYDIQGGGAHPYHLVSPSPWPFLSSVAAVVMLVGAILAMHQQSYLVLGIGVAGVLLMMLVWWRDVIKEAVVEKAHSPVAKIGMRYGMLTFIASEVMFFVAFFWAYFHFAFYPSEVIGGVWPPPDIQTFNPLDLPYFMTLVLLLSGTTVTWAHHAMREGHMKEAGQALLITVLLGIFFLCLQVYEYTHAYFGLSENVYSSTFYLATGFHGFHVLIGTIFLAVCWIRTLKNHFTAESHFGFEAAAWYWHFVDVVWLFLFISIYWFGSGSGH